jgi:SAM-dependent methyltransferase
MSFKLPDPANILQIGAGFMASRTLLAAVEIGLFGALANAPRTLEELRAQLKLHPRSAADFLDALVALGFLLRDENGNYSNAPDSEFFLDPAKPSYIGGTLEMCASRLYGFWGGLTEGLRDGLPQNEVKRGEPNVFEAVSRDPARLENFLSAMTGLSLGAAQVIAAKFPWAKYTTVFDIGCAQGAVPVTLAMMHPHLTGGGFDLPHVQPVFERYVARMGLNARLRFQGGNFFDDPWPAADVFVMGHILHDWDLPQKRALVAAAYQALAPGGALIVYDAMIDDERRSNAFGLLMSLNMLIETPGGFDYTGAQCRSWLAYAGFRDIRTEALLGPDSMTVGFKP